MRAVRQGFVTERRSLHLFVRMHLLQKLFGRNEKHLPELWRRTGPQATALKTNPQGINPADFYLSATLSGFRSPSGLLIPRSLRFVCFFCQTVEKVKERLGLAPEESIVFKSLNGPHRRPLCFGRTNN